ncbi:MAG: hypothetical protein ACC742_16980, partial [Thermoanaerobaculales bacterium]
MAFIDELGRSTGLERPLLDTVRLIEVGEWHFFRRREGVSKSDADLSLRVEKENERRRTMKQGSSRC